MAIRIGNNLSNILNGTSGRDLIFGNGGDDVINAGAGNDLVFGGAGNDQIFAGTGNDWVFGGFGNDVASGGAGNDFLFGDAGNDVLDGGLGSDQVDGGSGSDTLIFTDAERGGLDRYRGGSGQDALVLEFAAARWANPAVKAEVIAYLDFLAAGGTGNFTFTTMNLIVSSVEALVVKVDGVIIDPRAGGNTVPTGVADSYTTGENGVLDVSPATELGSLVDNDSTGTGVFTVELVTGPANGALTLNSDGTFSFNPGTAFDYLAAEESAVETFTYRIVNSAGASQPITVTLNIEGANDAAAITGDLSGAVKEDNLEEDNETYILTTSGQISVSDADSGEAGVGNPGTFEGEYGTLVLQSDGSWEYTLNNSSPAVQSLGEGDTAIDTFEVTSLDGTATQILSITVEGTNDSPSINGEVSGTVNEDGSSEINEGGTLTAAGQIIVYDDDAGESGVAGANEFLTLYGTLAVSEDGTWSYTLDSSLAEVQALRGGEIAIDHYAVQTIDGSIADVTIFVEGENDAAFVDGTFSDTITLAFEETTAEGFITVDDVDTGESGVVAGVHEGVYGNLSIDAEGFWLYQITNFDFPIDEEFFTVFENFELQTLGGDLFNIDITIEEYGLIES